MQRQPTEQGRIQAIAELLALGYLRHLRASLQASEKGFTRAQKGLDDVGARGKVLLGPEGPVQYRRHP